MKSGKEKVCTGKSDYRLDRTVDFPVKALGRVLDEFCCQYGKYLFLCITKQKGDCGAYPQFDLSKCRCSSEQRLSLHRALISRHPVLSKIWVHYNHTTSSSRVDCSTHSRGSTVLPLTTLYLERRAGGTNCLHLLRSQPNQSIATEKHEETEGLFRLANSV